MCDNFPNIRIVEGNNFAIILPLKERTYVSRKPIDEDIDLTKLENIVVTFGGVEYAAEIVESGIKIELPATLAIGVYNILLTADYLESEIRAAYQSAVTIVPWSEQSTAEQYIIGSPITLKAAYVLSGVLTDEELERLKEEWREKVAEAEAAKAEAEAAKEEWERKAEELEDVAKENTSQQILTAVGEAAKQGTDPTATNTAIKELIINEGIERASEYAAEIREIIGDWQNE